MLLSGFAKSTTKKLSAESMARKVNGVRLVRSEIVIQP
ncbi:hypothetical protein [Rhodoferax sp.]|nr:hypothetical protein [Rhodoferax sp.]MCM2342688.1 BON domain-containing protein [Rhodoferax sp.]